MTNFRTTVKVDGGEYETLSDILPQEGDLDVLFIAKTPAPISVEVGHYFQGKQGKMFWNMLANYDILKVPAGKYADECLLFNNYGITDVVKVPRDYGNEPSVEEYRSGLRRILVIIEKYRPKVVVFVYKKVLDNIMDLNFGMKDKSKYGFNVRLEKYFDSKVFVFPMPGTPCRREYAAESMVELKKLIRSK
jgi:mismatch-specific thymine-DNA glycosylase